MVESIRIFLLGLFYLSVLSFFLGLIRPVWVLWFLDRFNRLRVVKVYGGLILGFGLALIILQILA